LHVRNGFVSGDT